MIGNGPSGPGSPGLIRTMSAAVIRCTSMRIAAPSTDRSAKATNQSLASHGFQFRNDRDEWELTETGEAWAEAMPYSRNGHSGYQILWNPAVAEQLKEVA